MSRQQGTSVRKVVTATGKVSWTYRIDLPIGPDGKRRQQRATFATAKEAREAERKARVALAEGAYVERDGRTVDEVLDAWLASKASRWKPSTAYVNASSLRPIRELIGSRPAQRVRRQDLDEVLAELSLTRSPRSVEIALINMRAAFEVACRDGVLNRNPAQYVEGPSVQQRERPVWTARELRAFLSLVEDDPHVGAWHLTALGLRRGEVLGLRWSDVDWKRGVVNVRQSRVVVGGVVVAGAPKSARGVRTVPLHPAALAALRSTRERTGGVVPLQSADERLVVVDEIGEGWHPVRFSRAFDSIVDRSGLPPIRLHDVRHTVATLMLEAGTPPHVVAKVLGHDPAVLMRTYAHVGDESASGAVEALAAALG